MYGAGRHVRGRGQRRARLLRGFADRRWLGGPRVDQATAKKLTTEPKVTGEATRVVRQYGVCMQFDDEAALKAYDPNPEHKKWDEIYSKVRQYGTTTYDIIGQ